MALIENRVGPQVLADGTFTQPRLSKDGSNVVQDAHGRYQEAAYRGNLWSLSTTVAGVTVAAANVVGAANSAPIVGVYNPAGSGKLVSILRAAAMIASGTLGAGGLVWAYLQGTASTGATGNSEVNQSTFQSGGTGLLTYVGAAATGITSKLMRLFGQGGPTTGAAAANAVLGMYEETAGGILVPQGAFLGLMAAAAGTSPIVMAQMEFEIIPA